MDTIRAKQIMQSTDFIQVLHNGEPVWIENIKDNNSVEVTNMTSMKRETVPVYMLVENNPVK